MSRDSDTVFVGNLPGDTRERELDDLFHKYGRIAKIDVKSGRGGAGFAFVQFSDARDADDAVRGRDGYDFDGKRIRVELTRGSGPRGPGGRPMRDGGGYDRGDRFDRGGGRGGGGGPPRRSDYKLVVEGLPHTGSWQDLKDHLKSAGEICFADVNRDGTGIVEFEKHEDLKYAIKKFDDTKFTSHKGDTAYIRLKEGSSSSSSSRRERGGRGRDRSASRSRSRSRSPVARRRGSPSRSRSRSGSRKSRSRSPSKSPRGSPSPKKAAPRRSRSTSSERSRKSDRSRSASPAQKDGRRSRSGSPASHGSRSPSR